MRFAAWVSGNAVFPVRLTTNFKQMLPLNSSTYADTEVQILDATKLRVVSHLYAENDAPVADAYDLSVGHLAGLRAQNDEVTLTNAEV